MGVPCVIDPRATFGCWGLIEPEGDVDGKVCGPTGVPWVIEPDGGVGR